MLKAVITISGGGGGGGTVTEIDTGTGLTGGPITGSGTVSIANSTANSLAGYDNSGTFSDVTVGSGLSLSGGTLTASGGGTVTTTGSPANGNLTKFSGASSITNGDLGGDVTTSGTLATTVKSNLKVRNITAWINAASLNSPIYLNNIPFSGTITGWTMDGQNVSGSAVVDIWKVAYASYPPTVANTITGSALPTLTSQKNNTSTTLTGWTTSITAGDVVAFNLNSISTITLLCLTIQITAS